MTRTTAAGKARTSDDAIQQEFARSVNFYPDSFFYLRSSCGGAMDGQADWLLCGFDRGQS